MFAHTHALKEVPSNTLESVCSYFHESLIRGGAEEKLRALTVFF